MCDLTHRQIDSFHLNSDVVPSCAAASASMDALEDSSEKCLWLWELRDVKAIPKALKPAARDHKKLMHKV